MNLDTIGKWVPLIIAAGYFLFLVATYVKVVSQFRLTLPEPVSEKAKDGE